MISKRCSQRMITKTTRFNIVHENIRNYGYHGYIYMQTDDAIKYTLIATDKITTITNKDRE